MHVSLSELEATLCKAASGVGLPLGLGQDAGRAARWLAGRGQDSLSAFVEALDAVDRGRSGGIDAERAAGGRFAPAPPADRLSALRAGPAACDFLLAAASSAGSPREIALEAVDCPAVILMLAGAASRETASALRLSWRTGAGATIEAVCQSGRIRIGRGVERDLPSPGPAAMTMSLTDPQRLEWDDGDPAALRDGVSVDGQTWRRLAAFADRCLVEATETSRLTGAGAGVVDTD